MAFSFNKRIQLEAKKIKTHPPENIIAGPLDNNLMHWNATIIGPTDSPYEGGKFNLDIEFPNNYPFQPPTIKFITKVYHPNISRSGEICLDILKDQWSPALRISKVLMSICSLLTDPNPDDPLTTDAANLYKQNREEYNKEAYEWTKLYAIESTAKSKKIEILEDSSYDSVSEESPNDDIMQTEIENKIENKIKNIIENIVENNESNNNSNESIDEINNNYSTSESGIEE